GLRIADCGSCSLGVGRVTWTAAQVAAALGIPITHAGEYDRVSTDTRQISAGDLFVALKGDRFDAHDFLADAKGKGAAAAVVPRGIARLRDVIEPTIAAITNVGYAHVEGFGSLEGVLREKLALVDGVAVAVVGTDPPELAREARRRTRTVVAGTGSEADVRPEAADLDDAGHPRITWGGGHAVTVPVLGFHQIENVLLALAVGREAGVDPGRAVAALAGVKIPGGRGTALERGRLTILDDTYNANPASLAWAVRFAHWLAWRRGRPLAVVVGSMLELGDESDRLHAAAAREIAALEPALIGAVGACVPAF